MQARWVNRKSIFLGVMIFTDVMYFMATYIKDNNKFVSLSRNTKKRKAAKKNLC